MQNRQFTCNTIYLSEKKIHCIEGSYSAITGITDYLVHCISVSCLCAYNREVQSRKTTINYPFLPPIGVMLMHDREARGIHR